MSKTRKIAAILVADIVGYSRLAGADEDRTLSGSGDSAFYSPAFRASVAADARCHSAWECQV